MKILKPLFFAVAVAVLLSMSFNSCKPNEINQPEEIIIDDNTSGDDNGTPGGDDNNTPGGDDNSTPGGDDNETPGGNDDETPGGNDNNTPGGDDDDGPYKEYPYISEVGLHMFDGDNPLTDANPIFTFSNDMHVVLNPARSCQLKIGAHERPEWELHLLSYNPSVITTNTCFNTPFEIQAANFNRSAWRVRLFQPGTYFSDKYSTEHWNSSQGSINITPSQSFYTDPNYGDHPKQVTFTFNNVRVGYWDGDKRKSIRIHGVITVTKQD